MQPTPKLFISYCWSSPDHEKWVEELAERLQHDGVHVILDKWDLKEGHDAHAFMEQVVTNDEVKKVAIVFDQEYVRRADERDRGVGAETRLITGEIYKKSTQDKFVAVIAEKDENNEPYIPAYYSGRIYIDLTSASRSEEEYERLVRWIFDKPLYVRPPLGKPPAFLDDKAAKRIGNTSDLKRAISQLQDQKPTATIALEDYLNSVAVALEQFRIVKAQGAEFDQQVIDSIEAFTPTRDDLVSVFQVIARYMPTEENVEKISRFFEKLLRYFYPLEIVGGYSSWDFDNFKFIIWELYLYSVACFLDAERFEQAATLINSEFHSEVGRRYGDDAFVPATAFNHHIESLGARSERLKLNGRQTQGDLLRERAKLTSLPFASLAQADLVLYLTFVENSPRWWPFSAVYLGSRTTLPMFVRARSLKYFERIRPVLGNDDVKRFTTRIREIAGTEAVPRWPFHRLPLLLIVGADGLGTRP
ncbi:TIR domain-containing protein [Paraburkholderia tropica]|uniref:toll/interleukin-1 receptor domain-containing protein n=1 Tax=Paraburkholderia tropica TaxID=92647 RepID=UPI001602A630|nr:toll/interleukin-1 receptor domain-containing protein [Paraburkholderia tropica]QNB11546.1 TIR domain-containing protein [Paraburkholderia tropica]